MRPDAPEDRWKVEWSAVAVITLIGAGLRLWPLGRLGLVHFDEGIYAMVASSVFPMKELIAYAPPGYPLLGRLAGAFLGRSDGALIGVSQLAGILTIPIMAWLGRRCFGPGAGFASSVFCALSGPHVASSRMALTDASFLLAWLLAIGAGLRFLDRPGLIRGVVLGLAVGMAQEFKYNGWLSGGIVIGSAVLGLVVSPESRKIGPMARTFGYGLVAAGVAWLVVWPWFGFVEANGGYAALLRHQRNYLDGVSAWWPNLMVQIDQTEALSGGWSFAASVIAIVFLGIIAIRPPAWLEATSSLRPWVFYQMVFLWAILAVTQFHSPYRFGLFALPWLFTRKSPAPRLLGVWWLAFAVSSPLYRPYARLWMPFHAVNWLLIGWAVVVVGPWLRSTKEKWVGDVSTRRLWFVTVAFLFLSLIVFILARNRNPRPQPDLLAPSDSVDQASELVSARLPKVVKELKVLVRPPITYYLAGRISLERMAGSDDLLRRGPSNVWALIDSWMLRSERGGTVEDARRFLADRYGKDWEFVEEFPTTMSLPTLLDLDPGAARSTSADRSSPLWLLRPRRQGPPR